MMDKIAYQFTKEEALAMRERTCAIKPISAADQLTLVRAINQYQFVSN